MLLYRKNCENMFNIMEAREAFPDGYHDGAFAYKCTEKGGTITCEYTYMGERFVWTGVTGSDALESSAECDYEAERFVIHLIKTFFEPVQIFNIHLFSKRKYWEIDGSIWTLPQDKESLIKILPSTTSYSLLGVGAEAKQMASGVRKSDNRTMPAVDIEYNYIRVHEDKSPCTYKLPEIAPAFPGGYEDSQYKMEITSTEDSVLCKLSHIGKQFVVHKLLDRNGLVVCSEECESVIRAFTDRLVAKSTKHVGKHLSALDMKSDCIYFQVRGLMWEIPKNKKALLCYLDKDVQIVSGGD